MPRKNDPNNRKNITQACENCKKAKTKCIIDNTSTCKRCIKKNINCEFLPVNKKRGPESKNHFKIRIIEESLFNLKYYNDMYGEEYDIIKENEYKQELYKLKR
jgi:hypothetical protein